MVTLNEQSYCLGFSVFSGIGPGKFKLLLDHFKTAKEAWEAKEQDLKNVIGEKLTFNFEEFRNSFSIESYAEKLKEKDVWFLTQRDPQYPSLLLQTDRAPIVLYGKGVNNVDSSELNYDKTIGVVGTRKVTGYGRQVTGILTKDLVQSGFVIISGLALGVDAVAHKTAIENGGKTIAVLGCGVDLCYPSSNKKLYDEIINGNGAVVSEFPIGMIPSVGSFLSRNRIIAGLSLGILVTEGAEDSGSLITADYAVKYGRKVFAVPGPITSSLAKGPNSLISKGAKLVTNSKDILNEFQISNIKFQINTNEGTDSGQARMTSKFQNLTREEEKVLEVLQNEAVHFDEIVRRIGFNSSKVGTLLTILEIKGMIKSLENGMFSVSLSS